MAFVNILCFVHLIYFICSRILKCCLVQRRILLVAICAIYVILVFPLLDIDGTRHFVLQISEFALYLIGISIREIGVRDFLPVISEALLGLN